MDADMPPFDTSPIFWLNSEDIFDGTQLLSSNNPIVVFDSGVGGLTVTRQLENLIPNANLLYVADNEWFPYGNKPGFAIAQRVHKLLDLLCVQVTPLAIVVACNTASMALLEHGFDKLRHNYFLIYPPIVDAIDTSENKNIVVLATPSTMKSKHVIKNLEKTELRAKIWPIATQALVALSEARLKGEDMSLASFAEQVDSYLTEEQRLSIDTVVLGCTHFPHLIEDLRIIFPNAHNWTDPAKKLATQILSLTKGIIATDMPFKTVLFTSKRGADKYLQTFTRNGFGTIEPASIGAIL